MTMTDPIADMLTRIRNGNVAYHDEIRMPTSKLKESLAEILARDALDSGRPVAPLRAAPDAIVLDTTELGIDAIFARPVQAGLVKDTINVAVIDTGVDFNHVDLRANMWKNEAEIPANGLEVNAGPVAS